MNNRFLKDFQNDEEFVAQLQDEINKILDEETKKSDDEMDFDLINDCVDALLYLNRYDDSAFSLTPKIVKKFHTKLQLTRMIKGFGALVAMIIIALIVVGVYNTSNHDSYISEVESATIKKIVETTNNIQKEEEVTTAPSIKTEAVTKNNFNEKKSDAAKTTGSKKAVSKESSTKSKTTKESQKPSNKPEKTTSETSTKRKDDTTRTTAAQTTEEKTDSTTKAIETIPTLESISGNFGAGFRTIYFVGEEFDSYGLEVVGKYSDGSTKTIPIDKCFVYGFNSSKAGTCTVVISHAEKSFSFKVRIAG